MEKTPTQTAKDAEKAQKEYEKARIANQKEQAKLYVESRVAQVRLQNEHLEQQIHLLEHILLDAYSVDPYIDIQTLKQTSNLLPFDPGPLTIAEAPPQLGMYAPLQPTGIQKFLPGAKEKYAQEKCILCHAQIPEGLSECLECGTVISYGGSDGEVLADDKEGAQQPLVIRTASQSQRSWEVLQTPTPVTLPFQEMRSSRVSFLSRKGFILLGTIVMTIIIAGSGLFLYLARLNTANSTSLGQPNHTNSIQHLVGNVPTSVFTSTPATLSDPYPPYSGTLRVNDSLRDNSGVFNWMDDSVSPNSENQGCRFIDGTYHIVNTGMSRAYMIYCVI